jgi:PilX N-terminal
MKRNTGFAGWQRRNAVRTERQNGIALITSLIILLLICAIVVGMSWMVMTDQRLSGNNKSRENAFYAAEAGMEKLTTDMGNAFATQGALNTAAIAAIEAVPPIIPGAQYQNALGQSTYQITCLGAPCPNPPPSSFATILPPSPYAGMQALITPFTLSVAAQEQSSGAEVKLQRQMQLVAIPVFQFGIFSQTDLAMFPGPQFNFGGRVHTNGNLWLAANAGPLDLADKVTAVGQVIRTNLENGDPIAAGGAYSGNVYIALVPNPGTNPPGALWRALGLGEGSVSGNSVYGAISATPNNPTWSTVVQAYNGMLENNVPQLNLTSTALNGIINPLVLIQRSTPGELAANPGIFAQQYFSEASLRILIDDYGPSGTCADADMMALDTVTATIPVDLATLSAAAGQPAWWSGAATFYPLPTASDTGAYLAANGYWMQNGKPIITGCIKADYQNVAGAWTDVTQEILNEGFIGRNVNPQAACVRGGCPNIVAPNLAALAGSGTVIGAQGPPNAGTWVGCSDPNPNAIIRLARLRDNPSTAPAGGCGTPTANGFDYWPNVIYDTRESISRDVALGSITAQGVLNYVELDVTNLDRWFTGAIGVSGPGAKNSNNGFVVYFSDRRGNQPDPVTGVKTGAFGFNDIINPSDPANGCPNGVLDAGEDFVGDGTLRTYGGTPLLPGDVAANLAVSNLIAGVTTTVFAPNPNCAAVANPPAPDYLYVNRQEARENPPLFFRRALKIVNGGTLTLGNTCNGAPPNPPCGLAITAENPVYVQGEFNDGGVNNGTWAGPNVAASVAGDSVTLLSDTWNDANSFISPYNLGGRSAGTTSYRMAIIAGKGIPFPIGAIGDSGPDYGTDGGLHNFLRYLENWGGQSLYYKGSLVSFYFNAQAIGPYKCCNTVYSPPTRNYIFDADFTLGLQWLPPDTPNLRSVNTVGFSQQIMPTQ